MYLDVYQAALHLNAETRMSADCTITLLHFGVVEHSVELLMGDY